MLLTFSPSYVECYQILSGNQTRLYLSSCFFACRPHILPLISLIDLCNLYFQGNILFALLVVSSALPNVRRFFWLFFMLGFCTSNVRHPHCVLYSSKELGMLTLTVEHNYIYYYIIGVYNNDMFRPYMWAIIRLWLDLELRLY